MTLEQRLAEKMKGDAEAKFPCEPPCDSLGVCDSCCDAKVYRAGANSLARIVVKLVKALEYYADMDGGPYAPGDYHTADGGERALTALAELDAMLER